jgi:hypothetical protein
MFRHPFRYEHRDQPLLPWRLFWLHRVARTGVVGAAVIAISLIIGIVGYRLTEGLDWLDAFLNASMILGGMGPVATMHTVAGKLFASFYALYSGLVLVATAGLLFAPFLHRLLHRFHLEGRGADAD